MASAGDYEKLVLLVEDNFKSLEGIDVQYILREEELGSQLSFIEAKPIVIKSIDLFNRAKKVQIREIPYNKLNKFNSQLHNFLGIISAFVTFDPNTNAPVNERDNLIQRLGDQYDSYYEHTLPILTIGLLAGNDLSVQKVKLDSLVEEFEKKQIETEKISQKHLKDLQETLKNAEAAAAQVGISKHSIVFKTEAESHENEAKIWLKWTIIILIAIVIFTIGFLFIPIPDSQDIGKLIQFTFTKLIVLSTLFYGLTISTRNYKAHRHNTLINKHRHNALTTFETFSKAAGTDQQTKNAVLLEATHTIFSNQQTGYLNSEKEVESSNKFVEIIKNVAEKNSE